MKTIFKIGDKVFHICYGWGEVIKVDSDERFGLTIMFNYKDVESEEYFSLDGKEFEFDLRSILSFTEYTLQGFSQEKPIILPEVGEEIMVSDAGMTWRLAIFHGTNPTSCKYPYHTSLGSVMYFKRLR